MEYIVIRYIPVGELKTTVEGDDTSTDPGLMKVKAFKTREEAYKWSGDTCRLHGPNAKDVILKKEFSFCKKPWDALDELEKVIEHRLMCDK